MLQGVKIIAYFYKVQHKRIKQDVLCICTWFMFSGGMFLLRIGKIGWHLTIHKYKKGDIFFLRHSVIYRIFEDTRLTLIWTVLAANIKRMTDYYYYYYYYYAAGNAPYVSLIKTNRRRGKQSCD